MGEEARGRDSTQQETDGITKAGSVGQRPKGFFFARAPMFISADAPRQLGPGLGQRSSGQCSRGAPPSARAGQGARGVSIDNPCQCGLGNVGMQAGGCSAFLGVVSVGAKDATDQGPSGNPFGYMHPNKGSFL